MRMDASEGQRPAILVYKAWRCLFSNKVKGEKGRLRLSSLLFRCDVAREYLHSHAHRHAHIRIPSKECSQNNCLKQPQCFPNSKLLEQH